MDLLPIEFALHLIFFASLRAFMTRLSNEQNKPIAEERLQGSVERVTFHSEESGFCVLRTKIRGFRDLVTVIGTAASITAGEYIECQGSWVNDKNHGLQFKCLQLKVVPPTTLLGIEKYLGSGMVKGIGPFFAKRLVKAFGEDVFDVIEKEPDRLLTLPGIGKKRLERVVVAWTTQKAIRGIMVFLQSHGVGTARAVRIYKTYGDGAIDKVRANPYCLAKDIRGIGFKIADTIAEKLGVAKDSLIRAEAGIQYVLHELCENGHCAVLSSQLLKASMELLDIPENIIATAITDSIKNNSLIEDSYQDETCIYPVSLYQAETKAAESLNQLNQGAVPWGDIVLEKAIPWIEKETAMQLSDSQRAALKAIISSKISVITGGPGVGKTTLVNSLLRIIRAKQVVVSLCAPTGRAAKRLTETTGILAKTIHRLLEFDPKTYGFKHNQSNLLRLDVLIIDESSMLDIVLLYHLLKAIPKHAAVIFVGDIDQLPSVGSGAVLADLIASGKILTVRLTEIFRQAAHSKIIVNAHRVNQGRMPLPNAMHHSDFFTMYAETPEEIHKKLLEVVAHRLPKFYKFDPIKDIQVLTPMNRGGLGTTALNQALQIQLNQGQTQSITRFGTTFAPGDKVIQVVNNYEKDVYNGDIGFIESIDLEENKLTICFDNKIKTYDASDLDELSLAYAISIHKSQGSEFPVVVIPVSTQHYTLLARNLLYTGITRGKKLVVLIGQKKAIGIAVSNNKEAHRLTKLASRVH